MKSTQEIDRLKFSRLIEWMNENDMLNDNKVLIDYEVAESFIETETYKNFQAVGYIDTKIQQAIDNVKHKAPIVREFRGFIVLAQTEVDYKGKCNRIVRGDSNGFYTIKCALVNGG